METITVMSTQKKCVCILGSPHSGFSLLNGCFHILESISVGDDSRRFFPSFAKEDFELCQSASLIHDSLSRDINFSWDFLSNLPRNWRKTKAAAICTKRIDKIIKKVSENSDQFIIADLLLARFFPLWMDVFNEYDIEPLCVLLNRHPYEVALSLHARESIPLQNGHILWYIYMRDSFLNCTNLRHCMLTFDGLLSNPIHALHVISKNLDVEFSRPIEKCKEIILDFVRPDLKTSVMSHEIDSMFEPYSWLYNQMRLLKAKNHLQGNVTQFSRIPHSSEFVSNELAAQTIPLIGSHTDRSLHPEAFYANAMIDNLLSMLCGFEQRERSLEVKKQRQLLTTQTIEAHPHAQIYLPQITSGEVCYTDDHSEKFLIVPNEWQTIKIPLRNASHLRDYSLRIDPLHSIGIVHISSCRFIDEATGSIVFQESGSKLFDLSKNDGIAVLQMTEDKCLFLSARRDSKLFLFPIPSLPDKPLFLEIWIKVELRLEALSSIINTNNQLIHSYKSKIDSLNDRAAYQDKLLTDSMQNIEQLTLNYNAALENLDHTQQELDASRKLLQEYSDSLIDAERNAVASHHEKERLQEHARAREQELSNSVDAYKLELKAALEALKKHADSLAAAVQQIEQLRQENEKLKATARAVAPVRPASSSPSKNESS